MRFSVLIGFVILGITHLGLSVEVEFDATSPRICFAAGDIQSALQKSGILAIASLPSENKKSASGPRIVLGETRSLLRALEQAGGTKPTVSEPQGYSIQITRSGNHETYWVLGVDDVGAMYGGLDVAESIGHHKGFSGIKEVEREPYIANRGIKFNIPLDARTPSYGDAGHAAQLNITTMWDIEFWKGYLDDLARYRYNVVSLWNSHPFPSLIKLDDYPDVALDNVMRTTLSVKELHKDYNTNGAKGVTPEILDNLEVVKEISIDEKIEFWKAVMQHGHDRGIDFMFFTWNVMVWGADGKHGITGGMHNSITKDYYRQCIVEIFRTYPLLAGFGITAGEKMQGATMEEKEKYLYDTYGEGMNEALLTLPEGRSVRLIHRGHQVDVPTIASQFSGFQGTLDFSLKYAGAHIYGNTDPSYVDKDFDALPADKRAWVELRNDDIFNFRWGDPDFVRSFIQNLPGKNKLTGFLMGSDGYVWGREFTSTEPDSPRQLEIDKHWYRFMLWGKLGYHKDLSDAYFQGAIQSRIPAIPADSLMRAWTAASKVFPRITEFYWYRRDLEWTPEGCLRRDGWLKFEGPFHTVIDFANGPKPEPGNGDMMSVSSYVKKLRQNRPIDGTTPLELADELDQHAKIALDALDQIGEVTEKTARLTIGDIKCMALLGQYYADKIRGAVSYKIFELGQGSLDQVEAIRHMKAAAIHWSEMAEIASSQYRPQILARNDHLDWNALTKYVLEDITLVGGDLVPFRGKE